MRISRRGGASSIGADPLVDFAAKGVPVSPEHSRITPHLVNPVKLRNFDVDKLSILGI